MKLFFRTAGEGDPLIILHGLFGSSDNWMTLAKKYANDFKVIVIDLRNHGQSPHCEEFSYEKMSDDVLELIEKEVKEPVNIIGHSMGGKVAMKLAVRFPSKIKKLIIADIAPKKYPVHHEKIINALKSLELSTLKNRNDADKSMSNQITTFGERQFLLKNLKRTDVGFEWKMALNYIADNIENVGEALNKEESFDEPTIFIRGEKSSYIKDEDIELIAHHFKNHSLETIDGAGHWLHAEKPEEFFNRSMKFLKL